MNRALGKLPAAPDPRTPRFGRALLGRVETPPDNCNWYAGIGSWPMYLNDQLGCCVPAGAAHQFQQRQVYAGEHMELSDQAIVEIYKEWAGYDGTPATDNGTEMSTAMKLWMSQGIPLPDGTRDRIEVFAEVDHQSESWLKRAIWHTGGVLLGFNIPQRWAESVDYLFDLEPGDVDNIAGGHCVFLPGYEATALGTEFDIITWGFRGRMTWRALEQLADEAYCVLNNDWLNKEGVDPAGIQWADAIQAMTALRQG
jgi:hypothetical protein